MTRIKLCGLSRIEDILAANKLKPDYIGFVLWDKSSRFVSRDKALELRRVLLPGIKAVGVFVDEDPKVVASLIDDGIIDIAQLHGKEDRNYIRQLRRLSKGGEIIKALQVKPEKSLEEMLDEFRGVEPDYFLIDSGTGSGQTFNWDLIRGAEIERPYFLAGGLDPENVSRAIEALRPFAVDVSSGIETDRVKDPQKMKDFVQAVRDMD